MAESYCTQADLFNYGGLTRDALTNRGRLVVSVNATTDTFTLGVHALDDDQPVTFRAEAGGSLPAPLVEGTTYYAIPVSEASFKVAATAGGAAINLTTSGSRVLVMTPLRFDASIAWASREIDNMLPAHLVPLTSPIEPIVAITCAELAAWHLVPGVRSKSLGEMHDKARTRLERWAKGVPIRGDNAPPPAGVAVSSASYTATSNAGDSRGWRRYGGIT